MHHRIGRSSILFVVIAAVALGMLFAAPVGADHGTIDGKTFATLEAPFTQELIATAPQGVFAGAAFAPDGDVWSTSCGSDTLFRIDLQGVAPEQGGSKLHPVSSVSTRTGCGIVNHPNGSLYTNTCDGDVTRIDINTGAETGAIAGDGNCLGIAVDPQTGDLVFAANDGSIKKVDPGLTTVGTFSAGPYCDIDGIYFDPTGNFLFMAERCTDEVIILDRSGNEVSSPAVGAPLDGIAFKALDPKFVVTVNTDGTMSKLVFPGNDYSQAPTITEFASGAFYGDIANVGADGCLYVSEFGTRFNDLTETSNGSITRVCGGFAAPPGVGPGPTPEPEPAPEAVVVTPNFTG